MIFSKLFSKKKNVKSAESIVVRRPGRVSDSRQLDILVEVYLGGSFQKVDLVDISAAGFSFSILDTTSGGLVGADLFFRISIEGNQINSKISIIHQNRCFAGGAVFTNACEFEKLVKKHLLNEIAASSMKEIATHNVKQRAEGATRWWNGGDSCDLVVVEKDNELVGFEFTFFGIVVSGGLNRRTIFGTIGAENTRFKQFGGANIINSKSNATKELREQLVSCIANIDSLEPELGAKIKDLVKGSAA